MGAWIETTKICADIGLPKSHPTWVRGLKLLGMKEEGHGKYVAPYVGAWIETFCLLGH